jgi:hypothetical protein
MSTNLRRHVILDIMLLLHNRSQGIYSCDLGTTYILLVVQELFLLQWKVTQSAASVSMSFERTHSVAAP